jgi:hypothetical protein
MEMGVKVRERFVRPLPAEVGVKVGPGGAWYTIRVLSSPPLIARALTTSGVRRPTVAMLQDAHVGVSVGSWDQPTILAALSAMRGARLPVVQR